MALLNIGSDDPALRLTAYNLLYSLCSSFRFAINTQLMNARGKHRHIKTATKYRVLKF